MVFQDPFDVLGVPPRFGLGDAEIRRAWMARALDAHPDREGDASRSADVNAALQVLRDPVSRAEALLRRIDLAEGADPSAPPGFLLEVIELRERLDGSHGCMDERRAVRIEAQVRLAEVLEDVAGAFEAIKAVPADPGVASRIRTLLGKARALRRVLESIDAAADAARPS